MSLAELSVKRPIFISCLILLSLIAGISAFKRLGVDLFPDVAFPVVTVTTPYPGAGPREIETLISRPLEDELSTLPGMKRLISRNQEGVSVVIAEFTLETDVKYIEQQVRDRVGAAKTRLPREIKEPIIRRLDPADQPILTLALKSDLPAAELHDLADEVIKPALEQVNQVGLVQVIGGRKREIHVSLDRAKMKRYEISALQAAQRIGGAGENIPSGKKEAGERETLFRTVGQFERVEDIRRLIVNFFGNEIPVRVADIGQVQDTLEDEKSQTYLNEKKSLFIYAFKQSGANTLAVVEGLIKKVEAVNQDFQKKGADARLEVIRDGSKWIRTNVHDVQDSIFIGSLLAVAVVFLFLANGRSTIITGLALPNSLIGAFILMALAGFTINILTLLALSLSVGLLIDDAIVVRENIFRHIEKGEKPKLAALIGTREVTLAVIATTLAVIAVFGPLGFLRGVTGQFFKQFGLTVCFAMAISLFDALTVAPMLSAYFAGIRHTNKPPNRIYRYTLGIVLSGFGRFQDWLDDRYEELIRWVLRRPVLTLAVSGAVFIACLGLVPFVPKTFLPSQESGEFIVNLDLPPGTNLEAMAKVALQISRKIATNPEVAERALTVGSREGDANVASLYVSLVPFSQRPGISTSQLKQRVRDQLQSFSYANPTVREFDPVGTGMRPFNVNIYGADSAILESLALKAAQRLREIKGLKDVDISFRPGKPEFRVVPDKERSQTLGVSTSFIGQELRAQVEGVEVAKFREKGIEYNVRLRMRDDQRDLRTEFPRIFVPNINGSLVRLGDVAKAEEAEGPSLISRQNRSRYVRIDADLAPGAGLADLVQEVTKILKDDFSLSEARFEFVGQAENFAELKESMIFAMLAGILFAYLVLASLYESFVIPFTIMLALPLAVAGSLVALYIGNETLNVFSMIGIVMLLGVATKNSILLVDYANRKVASGVDRATALLSAGRARLRPIMMTTMALIAGTVPIALGLNEASQQRTSMGVAIIGGLISSTLLTLVVVPAAYAFVDRFRVWSTEKLSTLLLVTPSLERIPQPEAPFAESGTLDWLESPDSVEAIHALGDPLVQARSEAQEEKDQGSDRMEAPPV